jgi:hypothetical protein
MAYMLSDREYEDFVQMRRLYLSGRDNGSGRSGPLPSSPRKPGDDRIAIIEIVGNESGGEIYTCDAYLPTRSFFNPASGNTSTNIKGTRIAQNAVFINLQGVGNSTHVLTHANNTTQKFFVGFLLREASSDSRAVFVGNALWTKNCT